MFRIIFMIFSFAMIAYGKGYPSILDSILNETLKSVLLEKPFTEDPSGYSLNSFNLFWINPICIDSVKTSGYSGPGQNCRSEISYVKPIDSVTCVDIKINRSVTLQKFGYMSEHIIKTIRPKSGAYKAVSNEHVKRESLSNSMNEIALRICEHSKTILSDSGHSSLEGLVPFLIDIRYGKREAWLRMIPDSSAIFITTSFIDTLATDTLNSIGIRFETRKNGDFYKISKEHKDVKNKVIVTSRKR